MYLTETISMLTLRTECQHRNRAVKIHFVKLQHVNKAIIHQYAL